ncbi:hypothetical protein KCU81_g695, partial [Aureobasidium melanogenum]
MGLLETLDTDSGSLNHGWIARDLVRDAHTAAAPHMTKELLTGARLGRVLLPPMVELGAFLVDRHSPRQITAWTPRRARPELRRLSALHQASNDDARFERTKEMSPPTRVLPQEKDLHITPLPKESEVPCE